MSAIEIEHRVAIIQSKAGFDIPDLWLTFYLSASPHLLEGLAEELSELQAVNLVDADCGFLYPKLPVPNSPRSISALISQVRDMAIRHNVDVIAVDADTTADPSTSQFAEIIRYDWNVG